MLPYTHIKSIKSLLQCQIRKVLICILVQVIHDIKLNNSAFKTFEMFETFQTFKSQSCLLKERETKSFCVFSSPLLAIKLLYFKLYYSLIIVNL